MKDRTTKALLASVAILLAAQLYRPAAPVSAAQADEAAKAPGVVRAQAFELVNDQGKVVAQLHLGEQGGGNLRLRSEDGTVRVKLGANDDGSSLILFDTEAEPALRLASGKSGTSATLSEKGKEQKVLRP